MLFADSMECPLSKEELLEMVEEEARLRVSTGFLDEVATPISQLDFSEQHHICFRWSRRRERAKRMEPLLSRECKRSW